MTERQKLADCLTVRPLTRDRTKGMLTCGPITVPCALGRTGVIARKREGDGATPRGTFELLSVAYRADKGRRPATVLPVHRLADDMGWCDDPRHPRYNRPVALPFEAGHEIMWRDDQLYDIVVVLDCNMSPPVKGLGSAIFFHIAREDYRPTEGCIAVSPTHMRLILSQVAPGCRMAVTR